MPLFLICMAKSGSKKLVRDLQVIKEWVKWYKEIGIDAVYSETPINFAKVKEKPKITPSPPQSVTPISAPLPLESHPALSCQTLDQLKSAMETFEGCTLKYGATNLVFSDGVPTAPVMIIGEAPGSEEDIQGKPFVGMSGQLLDRILNTIGLSRSSNVYITNMVNWRPPQNRAPTPAEIESCLPFLYKHIALVRPKIIVLAGGVAAKSLLHSTEGIMKLRGRWFDFVVPVPYSDTGFTVPLLPTYHPAFLLRSPGQKAQSWIDMLRLKDKLTELGYGV